MVDRDEDKLNVHSFELFAFVIPWELEPVSPDPWTSTIMATTDMHKPC